MRSASRGSLGSQERLFSEPSAAGRRGARVRCIARALRQATLTRDAFRLAVAGRWLVLCLAGSLGCISTELADGEAYLLSRVGYSEALNARGLLLRNVDTSEDVLIRPGRAVLTRVPAGRYYLRSLDSAFANLRIEKRTRPEALIAIEAGKINYVGSFLVLLTNTQRNVGYSSVEHTYPREVVEEARTKRARVFEAYPLNVARPSFDSTTRGDGSDSRLDDPTVSGRRSGGKLR